MFVSGWVSNTSEGYFYLIILNISVSEQVNFNNSFVKLDFPHYKEDGWVGVCSELM